MDSSRLTDARFGAPLLILEAVRSFLDEHGLGSGALSTSASARAAARTSPSCSSATTERGTCCAARRDRRCRPRRTTSCARRACSSPSHRSGSASRTSAPCARTTPCSASRSTSWTTSTATWSRRSCRRRSTPTPGARRRLANDLVDTLVEIHAADVRAGARRVPRPGNYNERQVRRFSQLWEFNQTRELPTVVDVGRWLARERARPAPPTVVHGDYRLGNMIVSAKGRSGSRPCSTGRWARSVTLAPTSAISSRPTASPEAGEPARDVAGHSERRFLSRAELVARYAERSGREVEPLRVVRGARALEGGGLLRGDLRTIRARRTHGRRRPPVSRQASRFLPRRPPPSHERGLETVGLRGGLAPAVPRRRVSPRVDDASSQARADAESSRRRGHCAIPVARVLPPNRKGGGYGIDKCAAGRSAISLRTRIPMQHARIGTRSSSLPRTT